MGIVDFFGFSPRETITYYPSGDLAAGISISAVVFRTPISTLQDTLVRSVEIQIPNDATAGVSSIAVGQDLADVKTRGFGAAQRIRITRMISGDAGVWRLIGSQ
jgi:hypothetical protein